MNTNSETQRKIVKKVATKKVVLLDVLSRMQVKEPMQWKEGKLKLKALKAPTEA